MVFKKKDLPSFMRMRELNKYESESKLHYVIIDNEIAGFYVLDGSMFKCLFIKPEYRGRGLASNIIKEIASNQVITIATTKRICGIKRIIMRLGFVSTGVVVQGKQSLLEIWTNKYER